MRELNFPDDRQEITGIIEGRGLQFDDRRSRDTARIIDRVRLEGDRALKRYTGEYDGVELDNLAVTGDEIDTAYQQVDSRFLNSLQKAIDNVASFHRRQLQESWFSYQQGIMTGQLINPLQRVGAYVPGGRAAYPSSVVMTVVPARTAGVEQVVVVTPPDNRGRVNPHTLVAARETGVTEIYKVGGAQAVAALAYGTETIRRVDKIVGPGNIYVTLAKKQVYGQVDIDMLAGPSEVLILADDSARPEYVAADLLSQAEHDPLSVPVLITTSVQLAGEVVQEVEEQLARLTREAIARESINSQGLIITVPDLDAGIDLVNRFAPEHFELVVREPFAWLPGVKNAGAIFIGEYTPEPLGDYLAGPNHVLPTGGTARFASPLNTGDFLKKTSLIYCRKAELSQAAPDITGLAGLEGLDAHARAVNIRFQAE